LEEAGEDVLIGDVFFRSPNRNLWGPAVGGEDGAVEFAVGVLESGGIFVVEVVSPFGVATFVGLRRCDGKRIVKLSGLRLEDVASGYWTLSAK